MQCYNVLNLSTAGAARSKSMGVDLLNVQGSARSSISGAGRDGEPDAVSRALARRRRIGLGRLFALQRAHRADDQGARRHAAMDRRRQGGRARRARTAISGIIWRWCIIPTVAAFIDMMTSADYETALRSAPHQWLRRARHHRDEGGVQQVQGGVSSARRINVRLSCSAKAGHPVRRGLLGSSFGLWNTGSPARAQLRTRRVTTVCLLRASRLKTSAPDPA